MKVAVVSGASGGIGKESAKRLVSKGYRVYDLSRSGEDDGQILHIYADVTQEETIEKAFAQIKAREGKIDLLLLCAGFGISGAAEFTEITDAKRQLEVNFFGVHLCTKYALPLLRESQGRILAISSAAAVFPIPFQSFYSASKSAINTYILALRNEVRRFGITAAVIMPGDVKTGFTAARQKEKAGEDVYGGCIGTSVAVMEKDEESGMKPENVAKYIVRIAEKKRIRPLYTAGLIYKVFIGIQKVLGMTIVNAILGKMYIKNPK